MTASYTYSRPQRVSEQARSKVLAAAVRLGYPGPDPSARSLRRGRTQTLGVVMGEHLTYAFDDPQAVQFMAGVAEGCAERAYGMNIPPITGGGGDVPRGTGAPGGRVVGWATSHEEPPPAAPPAPKRPAGGHRR